MGFLTISLWKTGDNSSLKSPATSAYVLYVLYRIYFYSSPGDVGKGGYYAELVRFDTLLAILYQVGLRTARSEAEEEKVFYASGMTQHAESDTNNMSFVSSA